MAITYGFFNAVKSGSVYDRTYTSENFCDYLGSMICDGVQDNYSDCLHVTAGSGLAVSAAAGKAWIDGHYLINSDALTIDISDLLTLTSGYSGYVIICAYCDTENRECGICGVTGNTYETSGDVADPEAPDDTDSITYLPLAAARLTYGSSSVSAIVDMREYTKCILGSCPNGLDVIDTYLEQVTELTEEIEELEGNIDPAAIIVYREAVGDDAIMTLYADGSLVISGSGEVTEVTPSEIQSEAVTLWNAYTTGGEIYPKIVVEDGITSIPAFIFTWVLEKFAVNSFIYMPETYLPTSVTTLYNIGTYSIQYAGTIAQWGEITRQVLDSSLTSCDFYVYCTDGTLHWSWNTLSWEEYEISEELSTYRALQEQVSTNTAAIEELQSQADTSATAIEELQSQVETNTTAIETNASNIEANTSAIEELQSQVSANTSAIEANASNIETNASAIETLQAFIDSLDTSTLATYSESVGDNAVMTLYLDGSLVISGSGAVTSGTPSEIQTKAVTLWNVTDNARTVTVESGITSLPASLFQWIAAKYSANTLKSMPETVLPATITSLGASSISTHSTTYAGTMAQWLTIDGNDSAVYMLSSYTYSVYCTDGTLVWNGSEWEEQ